MQRKVVLTYLFIMLVLNISAQETGTASFYSNRFQGARTTSGERLDNELYTAAHGTLPFGTLVKVTNLANEKWVVVIINDRGKFKKRGRIIDITLAAAEDLDMVRLGVAKVKLEIVQPQEGITIFNSLPILPPKNIEQLPIKDILPLPEKLAGIDIVKDTNTLNYD